MNIMIKSIRCTWALLIVCFVCGQAQNCIERDKDSCLSTPAPANRPPCVLADQTPTMPCQSFSQMPAAAAEDSDEVDLAQPIQINTELFKDYFQEAIPNGKAADVRDEMKLKFQGLAKKQLIQSPSREPISETDVQYIFGETSTPAPVPPGTPAADTLLPSPGPSATTV